MDDERTARVLALAGDLERLGQRWEVAESAPNGRY